MKKMLCFMVSLDILSLASLAKSNTNTLFPQKKEIGEFYKKETASRSHQFDRSISSYLTGWTPSPVSVF